MRSRVGLVVAAILALGASTQAGAAAEARTWYVYCEGASAAGHWAVFSENFWPHPESADYGHLVGSAAKAFFEKRHDVSLEGCTGVNFRDDSLAEHSRKLTAQLHRRMGDKVYFFPLPNEILPEDAPQDARIALTAARDESTLAAGGSPSTVDAIDPDPQWQPFTAPR